MVILYRSAARRADIKGTLSFNLRFIRLFAWQLNRLKINKRARRPNTKSNVSGGV